MLPPHKLDALFSSDHLTAEQIADRLLADGTYPADLKPGLLRAAQSAMQALREAQQRFEQEPRHLGPSPAQAARIRLLAVIEAEQDLLRIAERYRNDGYSVITQPGRDDLPGFAADFAVDAVARRAEESVLVRVKRNRADLQNDPQLIPQAEVTNAQPGWRFDLLILGKDDHAARSGRTSEPSREQIDQMIAEAEAVMQGGSVRAAFVLAWAGLEAAMRRYAQAAGLDGRIGIQPTVLIREVYGAGGISPDEFRRLESARQIRSEVVHGLAPSALEPDSVQAVIDSARKLLAESEATQLVAGSAC